MIKNIDCKKNINQLLQDQYKNNFYLKLLSILILILITFILLTGHTYAAGKNEKKSIKGNLKIVFIIDTSDSMNKDQRFIRVKKALNAFIDSLIEGDYFIVVTFDTKGYLKYSGVVGDEKVRKAIKRVFDDNYPDNEPVRGMASQIILGINKAFNEILETPTYQSTAVVLFTDGDHNPIPTEEEWGGLCGRIVEWQNEAGFKGHRKVFVIDVGDPKHSKIMTDDLKVPDEDYFPYSDGTDFGEILEKIRSKIPYSFNIKVFPTILDLGKFHNPKSIKGIRYIILNNPDFIEKGGFVTPHFTFYRNGEKIENPGFKTNIPDKIDSVFLAEPIEIKFNKNVPPGKYKIKISYEPGGSLNANLTLENEENKPVDYVEIDFQTTSWLYHNKPYVIAGISFLILLLLLYFIMRMHVKKMPLVTGKLHCKPEGIDVPFSEKELRQPEKIFIFNHGKSSVSVGSGRDADLKFGDIDFLEGEHFQIIAESNERYRVKSLQGKIEIVDNHDNPQYSRSILKNHYKVKVENPENPDAYVLFEIENRFLR